MYLQIFMCVISQLTLSVKQFHVFYRVVTPSDESYSSPVPSSSGLQTILPRVSCLTCLKRRVTGSGQASTEDRLERTSHSAEWGIDGDLNTWMPLDGWMSQVARGCHLDGGGRGDVMVQDGRIGHITYNDNLSLTSVKKNWNFVQIRVHKVATINTIGLFNCIQFFSDIPKVQ